MAANIREILKTYWGYEAFRPLQEDIIAATLSGYDTLALMPTGGGKSICFQVPALAKEGVCLVVTPLIALMKDQVFQLRKRKIPAAAIFSGMNQNEIDLVLEWAVTGKIKFLYLSPERLKTNLFRERLKRMRVGLLAIDEAHCISQWGYDFRPPYTEIYQIRELLPQTPCLALTATATPKVKQDIMEKLRFPDSAKVFVKSFARANLSYSVFYEEDKPKKILQILKNVQGSAIIYLRSRAACKEMAAWLRKQGISADYYHAGLTQEQRNTVQQSWIEGKIRLIAATNAFGMGIDKPDVRLVIHTELPDSLEAYYQEAGRAGRDEKKAYAVLLYNQNDIENLTKRTLQAHPNSTAIRKTYQSLANYFKIAVGSFPKDSLDFDIEDFYKKFNIPYTEAYYSLKKLEEQSFIQLSESFYLPSKLHFILTSQDLYNYQIRHPEMDSFIKTLMRLYGGLFSAYVSIQEKKIAVQAKITPFEVKNKLEFLAQTGVVDYIPQKDRPQLQFLTERYGAADLPLDEAFLAFRKNDALDKIRAVTQYVQNQVRCRTQVLLEYFGELTDKTCGVCDICIQKRKQSSAAQLLKNEQDSAQIRVWVLENLSTKPIELRLFVEKISTQYGVLQREKILAILKNLLEEELIARNQFGEIYKN
jgi:ATP-dependent DNA helicase RecQ